MVFSHNSDSRPVGSANLAQAHRKKFTFLFVLEPIIFSVYVRQVFKQSLTTRPLAPGPTEVCMSPLIAIVGSPHCFNGIMWDLAVKSWRAPDSQRLGRLPSPPFPHDSVCRCGPPNPDHIGSL
jgi:hypothetical protein